MPIARLAPAAPREVRLTLARLREVSLTAV